MAMQKKPKVETVVTPQGKINVDEVVRKAEQTSTQIEPEAQNTINTQEVKYKYGGLGLSVRIGKVAYDFAENQKGSIPRYIFNELRRNWPAVFSIDN
jgi:hypothetical protein